MKGVVFDLYGPLAHYRKPDTTATHMTYPFITPLAAKGLVGAVLGIEDFVTGDKVGIRLMNPVKTVSQQMSMLGKDAGSAFNRPTTIELVINPHYRIYYAGDEYGERLAEFLLKGHAIYPTYLGVAYALTKPKLVSICEQVDLYMNQGDLIETSAVVPSVLIKELSFQVGCSYSRAGGFLYAYQGGRIFEKSVDFVYEQNGKPISFIQAEGPYHIDPLIACFGKEVVCLC